MPNRLANSSSPYLRQHADNPVDWYPWGEEAFARARAEDKPVFLSIGYSSCHWCHVMAHESFEDEAVAAVLNRYFVCIKVDREERPDLDDAYMTAVQLTSGRGGWPMSVFLTPERRPFVAATYIPRNGRDQIPGFIEVCERIAQTWRTRRDDVEKVALETAEAIRETYDHAAPEATSPFDQAFLDQAVSAILSDFDEANGGFGAAPKFPPHSTIQFLFSYATETNGPEQFREAGAYAALTTLHKMCLGGIHDHVGGGFHRYSTDEKWLLPHFEKMLTDNALLLSQLAKARLLAEAVAPSMAEVFQDASEGIVAWLTREMVSPDGLFYTAIDADSEGEEGSFYVWRESEVRSLLGARGSKFLQVFGFEPDGNYRDEATGHKTGQNIPYLGEPPESSYADELSLLLEARAGRERPTLDDKVLVSANGLLIGALAENGLVEMAAKAADAILAAERRLGRLPHQIVDGEPEGDAFLDAYAYFTDALLRLASILEAFSSEGETVAVAKGPEDYRENAARLAGEMIARFYDDENGGFFFTSDHHQSLFGKSKPVFDQPLPSGNAVALGVLIEFGAMPRLFQTRNALLGWMERAPHATAALYHALVPTLDETVEPPVISEPVHETLPEVKLAVLMTPREIQADQNGVAESVITIRIPAGFHLNSNQPPARWLVPTKVTVEPLRYEVIYPPALDDRFVGEIPIGLKLHLPPGKSSAEFEVTITYQACTESECLLAEEKRFDGVVFR